MKKVSIVLIFIFTFLNLYANEINQKKIAYVVSDYSIPFWKIISKGIINEATKNNYQIDIFNSKNQKDEEIKNIGQIISSNYDGVIISPISSLSAKFLLKLTNQKNLPTVIADIGTEGGEYVSFISSDNYEGAYKLGLILAKKMKDLNLSEGTVGIVAIPQKRENGKLRTNGFINALNKYKIKTAGIKQQVDFSQRETYIHVKSLITQNQNLKAIWLQGSDKYKGAIEAIKDTGNEGKILLICFDAEPEFLEMIPNDELVGSAMQQPYLMGTEAFKQLHNHLNNKEVEKEIKLEILAISKENIDSKIDTIRRNVLGIEE